MKDALAEPESTKKGYKFEVFFENLMSRHKEFTMVYKHPRSEIGEVDYVYRHELQDHPFWRISPYICVECKNWAEKISSTQMNHLTELIREKGPLCCCGVFITSSSYDPSALTAIRDSRLRDKIVIVPVERKYLKGLIKEGIKDFIQKLCEKIVFKK